MPTVRELTQDPNFAALSPEAKAIVFDKLAPTDDEFSRLGEQARQLVRQKLTGFEAAAAEPVAPRAAENLARIRAEQEAPEQQMRRLGIDVSKLPAPGSLGATAERAAIGLYQGTAGFVSDIASKVARIVGAKGIAEKLDRETEGVGALAEYLSDGSTASVVAQHVGQQIPNFIPALGGAKVAAKATSVLKGAAAGGAVAGLIGTGIGVLEIAGARNDEERAAAIHELPKQLILQIAAGSLFGVAGSKSHTRKAALDVVADERPVVGAEPKLLPSGVYEMPPSGTYEAGLPGEPVPREQRLLGPAPERKLLTAGAGRDAIQMPASVLIEGAKSLEEAQAAALSRHEYLMRAGRLEEAAAWAQDAADLGAKLDPMGDLTKKRQQLLEAHTVIDDAVTAAEKRLPWKQQEPTPTEPTDFFRGEREGTHVARRREESRQAEIADLQQRLAAERANFDRVNRLAQAGQMSGDAVGVQRRQVESLERQIDGLQRGRRITAEETTAGREAIEQYNTALQAREAVRNELAIAEAQIEEAEAIRSRARTKAEEPVTQEPVAEAPPPEGPKGKPAYLTEKVGPSPTKEESVPRGTSAGAEPKSPKVKAAAKRSGKTRAAAQEMGQGLADKVFTERKRNAIENLTGMSAEDILTRANRRISELESLGVDMTPEELDALSPQGTQSLGALATIKRDMVTIAKEIHRMFAEHVQGNKQFIEEKTLAVGAQNERRNQIATLAAKLKALLPTAEADAMLRLAFDEKGIEKIRALNRDRVQKGLSPIWTDQHQKFVQIVQDLTDGVWAEQAIVGLIDVRQFREHYLPQMFTNPELAAQILKQSKRRSKNSPFSFQREWTSLYDAIEDSGGKLQLKYPLASEAIPAMLGSASQAVYDARLRIAAKKIPGAYLSPSEFRALPAKTKIAQEYVKVANGDFVRKDVFEGARYDFMRAAGEGPLSNNWWSAMKQATLMIDFQHTIQTFRALATHPRALVDPRVWTEAGRQRLASTEYSKNLVEIGGMNLNITGGDYVKNFTEVFGQRILPKELGPLENILRGSHHFVFEEVVPVQKLAVANAVVDEAFRAREKGHRFWKGKTDTEIYQTVAQRVENEFGNPDMRRLGASPKTIKALRQIFLAPEWNLSILRTTLHSAKELYTYAHGQPTDFYHGKRMLGYLATGALGTFVANQAMHQIFKKDFEGQHTWDPDASFLENMFTIKTPWKNPFTGRNYKLYTLGPQLEFWKMAYDLAEHGAAYAKGGTWHDLGKAAYREVSSFLVNRAHPVIKLGAGLVADRRADVPLPVPFSAPELYETMKDMVATGGHAAPENWIRLGTGLVGLRMHWDVPQLVVDDYQITSAEISRLRKEAYIKAANGLQEPAAKRMEEANDLIQEFVHRYEGSAYYEDYIAPYVGKLARLR